MSTMYEIKRHLSYVETSLKTALKKETASDYLKVIEHQHAVIAVLLNKLETMGQAFE
jgi:hypothetical protein